jgi:hypothetical protein
MRRVLMAGAAAPEAFTDPAEVLERAQRFGMLHRQWYLDLGLAVAYRGGDFSRVVQRFGFASTGRDGPTGPWEWLFMAMAQYRLKNEGEARKWLDKAATWIDAANQQGGDPLGGTRPGWYQWRERVLTTTLRREAETLLGNK